jgi:hypothetical protein
MLVSPPQVTARFSVRTERDHFVVEPDRVERDGTGIDGLYGRVSLAVSAGGTVFLEDDLTALTANFCFQAPAQLSADQPFAAYINRYPGDVFMEAAGTGIRISGNAVFGPDGRPGAELTAPGDPLITALLDCGRRALTFLHTTFDDDPTAAEALQALEGVSEECLATIEAARRGPH